MIELQKKAAKNFDYSDSEAKFLGGNGIFVGSENSLSSSNGSFEITNIDFDNIKVQKSTISYFIDGYRDKIKEHPVGKILITKDDNVRALSQLYGFETTFGEFSGNSKDPNASSELDLEGIIDSPACTQYLINLAKDMFPLNNPRTHKPDIDEKAYYAKYVPLVILTNTMPPQISNGKSYFNANGTVSVAEFIDGINAIKYGMNSNITREKTIDNVSTEDDYFNMGYNNCLRGFSSPLYNLYTRRELLEPITRGEAAYITTLCWSSFIEKYGTLFGGRFYMGINFDWEHPIDYVNKFEDGRAYKVSKIRNTDFDTVEIDIKSYKGDVCMGEYKENLIRGIRAIPLPLYMCTIETYILGLLPPDTARLDPLKQVSRGELCYFLMKLAKLFPLNYI